MMEEHEFNKKEAQQLMVELQCFLILLKVFCEQFYYIESFDNILIVLKHILKISGKLFNELDSWQVVNIDYEENF